MSKFVLLFVAIFISAYSARSQSSNIVKPKNASVATSGEIQAQSDGNLTFKVLSVVGNKKSQIVNITILVTNKGANYEVYNTRVKGFISEDGEEFTCESAIFGSKASAPGLMLYTTLYTDVPLKTIYSFKGVLPKIAKIKILPLPYFDRLGAPVGKIEFKDLVINWK